VAAIIGRATRDNQNKTLGIKVSWVSLTLLTKLRCRGLFLRGDSFLLNMKVSARLTVEDCRQGDGDDGGRRQQDSPEFSSWEDLRVLNERQVFTVVAIKGQLYLLPEPRPAKFEHIDHDGLREAGYGPDDFENE
jgi:hypothetical protein